MYNSISPSEVLKNPVYFALSNSYHLPAPIDILQQYWGYPAFRSMQEEIIRSVLDGKDTLALLPTGGGKSVCFQVPALVKEGVCIVVSPLIALMKDQVQQLQDRGIRADAIYSGLRRQDIDRILDNAVHGHLKFLYLSPERLRTDLFLERLTRMPVNSIAVDEAHCVSQWGYDFRPPYLQIAEIRDYLPDSVPLIALTATATPEVVQDIQDKLAFRPEGQVLKKSFVRENLAYVVRPAEGKTVELKHILRKVAGSAVVYVRNRRKCKEIAVELHRHNFPASFYHAGLSMEDRNLRQEGWINGKIRIMVATNAFGMGIDKADVHLVVHMDLPDNLEAYFQEAGRAGRDGNKAYAVLLYDQQDKLRLERNFEQAFPEMTEIKRVYRALGSYCQLAVGGGQGSSYDFDIAAFAQTYKLDVYRTYHCLKVLERSGWITVTDAVYIPAVLSIKVDKETLYDYQLRHPKLDRILKIILRTYQGAFNGLVRVKEKQLAGFLKIPVSELRQGLHTMHKEGIIHYSPAKDRPQLIFLEDRRDAEQLTIDWEKYRFRKERHLARMKAAIDYAEKEVCRSKQLLYYFGEKDAPNCGICDVCLARKKQGLTTLDFEQYRYKIYQALAEESLPAEKLVALFSPAHEEKVLEVLTYLLDEGYLEQNEGLIFRNETEK